MKTIQAPRAIWTSTRQRGPGHSLTVQRLQIRFSLWPTLACTLGFVLLALFGCAVPRGQQGGRAWTLIRRPGVSNAVHLAQSENPKESSTQTVQSEQSLNYVLPPGTRIAMNTAAPIQSSEGAGAATPSSDPLKLPVMWLDRAMPVRWLTKDRTETTIGGAQKDALREWAGKAASLQPVMWAGILMMTLVAGGLVYFGWWTKAGLAAAIGIGMVVLAQTLPDYGSAILLGGLSLFGVVAVLILYAYTKGQLDQNQNGVPDFLEKKNREVVV